MSFVIDMVATLCLVANPAECRRDVVVGTVIAEGRPSDVRCAKSAYTRAALRINQREPGYAGYMPISTHCVFRPLQDASIRKWRTT
jgi:hypothetical protein